MKRKPALRPGGQLPPWLAWLVAPVLSRGQFSPRLFLGWQVFYLMAWVIRRYMTMEEKVINGVLVQARPVGELVGILAALIAACWAFGSLQKIKLDSSPDAAPPEDDPDTEGAPPEVVPPPDKYCPPHNE